MYYQWMTFFLCDTTSVNQSIHLHFDSAVHIRRAIFAKGSMDEAEFKLIYGYTPISGEDDKERYSDWCIGALEGNLQPGFDIYLEIDADQCNYQLVDWEWVSTSGCSRVPMTKVRDAGLTAVDNKRLPGFE